MGHHEGRGRRPGAVVTICALAAVFGISLTVAGTLAAQGGATARAELKSPEGRQVGVVRFVQEGGLVRISARLNGLPPGTYALHIHENGVCAAPDFTSAGGHFNPTGAEHGFLNENGPHAGDLPNMVVGKDGTGTLEIATGRVSLDKGDQASLLKPGGTAVVVHTGPDDYITDPAGGGGRRIACGVVEQVGTKQ